MGTMLGILLAATHARGPHSLVAVWAWARRLSSTLLNNSTTRTRYMQSTLIDHISSSTSVRPWLLRVVRGRGELKHQGLEQD